MTQQEVFTWVKKQIPFFALFLGMFLTQIQSGKSLEESLIWAKAWLLNISISVLMRIAQNVDFKK